MLASPIFSLVCATLFSFAAVLWLFPFVIGTAPVNLVQLVVGLTFFALALVYLRQFFRRRAGTRTRGDLK